MSNSASDCEALAACCHPELDSGSVITAAQSGELATIDISNRLRFRQG